MKKLGMCVAMVALAIVGCDTGGGGTDTGVDTGGGTTDTGGGTDAGTDGGGGTTDTGTDDDAGGGEDDSGTVMTDTGVTPGTAVVTLAESCPDFTACGGDGLVGDWTYESICVEFSEIEDQFTEMCPGSMVLSGGGTATGSLEITDTEITRVINTTIMAEVRVGGLCALGCDSIPGIIMDMVPGASAECATMAGSGCTCDITFVSELDETNEYTIEGDTIVTGTGEDERQFEYCVEDDGTLRVHEIGGEPGTSTSTMD